MSETKGDKTDFASGAVSVTLQINGVRHELQIEPRISLLDALREYNGLTGTKKGCNQGACAALADGERINSCFALAADDEGKLTSLIHTGFTQTTEHNNFAEQFTFPARHLYKSENIWLRQEVVHLDIVPNTFMRAPGESPGTFALESAIDELAHEMGMDPIELRA